MIPAGSPRARTPSSWTQGAGYLQGDGLPHGRTACLLKNNFPDKADALYAKEVEDVARYAKYKKAGGLTLHSSYIPYYPSSKEAFRFSRNASLII